MPPQRLPAEFQQRIAPRGVPDDASRLTSALRSAVALAAMALLAACANTPGAHRQDAGSSLSVTQEAAEYRARAKSNYRPPGPPDDPWGPYIHEASARFDVPEEWIRAVMRQESGGRLYDRDGNFITSVPGAMGLMQLMPPTYDDMRQQYGLGDDPFDPRDNIFAGAAYMRQMYDIYGSPGFLAAYNDGPGSLDSYLRRGRPLPRETRRYVASIGPQIAGITPQSRSAADLLVEQHDPNAPLRVASSSPSPESRTISAAWTQKAGGGTGDTAPVEVAEAPASAAPASTTLASSAPASSAPADGSAPSVSAAWAARGIAPTPVRAARYVSAAPEEADSASDGPVSAQVIPMGHRLRAQPIMAVVRKPAASGPRNWAIQIGAFGSEAMARQATTRALDQGGESAARPMVAEVRVGEGKKRRARLYRARLTNLTHDGAVEACHHLSHSSCVVVPPGSF